jgi:hypothetical protein
MDRRTFMVGGGVVAAGVAAGPAYAQYVDDAWLKRPSRQPLAQVFEDFLRKVWRSGIEFQKLDIANPEPLPIGPTTVIGDNVGFVRTA